MKGGYDMSNLKSQRNKPLRIAYIGETWGTSLHRIRALERLGHDVAVFDPRMLLGSSKWASRWLYHTGGFGTGLLIDRPVFRWVSEARPDLIFVNQGEFLGPALLRQLRRLNVPIVNYTNDNPFSELGRRRFRYYRKALPYYDLVVVTWEENIARAKDAGARQVMRVWLSADEKAHAPRVLNSETRQKYASEVAFIGKWMPERGPFMAELIRRGVPLSIWGDRWHKAREWPVIAPYWRGPGIYDEDEYAAAIQSAKICLGLLSKGNHNLHTSRSIEIPSLGAVLCAERTSEHLALYEEGREAVFWEDAAEYAYHCHRLLGDERLRNEIARRGRQRALKNNLFNEPILASIPHKAIRAARSEA